jgi:transcriptional regulator with XRE-family HTH domain
MTVPTRLIRIRNRLAELGISQQLLAYNIGESTSRVSRLINGWTAPTTELLAKIADFLKIPLEDIMLTNNLNKEVGNNG